VAVLVAAVVSSVLGFVIFLLFGLAGSTGKPIGTDDLPAIIAIVLIWAPAFALVPAGILGWLVERPKARAMIKRGRGGFVLHVAVSVLAAAALSLLLRIGLHLSNPMYPLLDSFSLALFSIVGLCSGISWWFLVVLPGRRE
jgi:hypothetical protein